MAAALYPAYPPSIQHPQAQQASVTEVENVHLQSSIQNGRIESANGEALAAASQPNAPGTNAVEAQTLIQQNSEQQVLKDGGTPASQHINSEVPQLRVSEHPQSTPITHGLAATAPAAMHYNGIITTSAVSPDGDTTNPNSLGLSNTIPTQGTGLTAQPAAMHATGHTAEFSTQSGASRRMPASYRRPPSGVEVLPPSTERKPMLSPLSMRGQDSRHPSARSGTGAQDGAIYILESSSRWSHDSSIRL